MKIESSEIREKYEKAAPNYDWRLAILERVTGIRKQRRDLLGKARGNILDVATGTGRNYPYVPSDCSITGIDLSPAMLQKADARAQQIGLAVQLREMDAENMDFEDQRFDTVISTLSTCTFPDPVAVIREMARVCCHDGRLLFLEHGRSDNHLVARLQDRLTGYNLRKIGCHLNRDPLSFIKEAGLYVADSQRSFFGSIYAVEATPGQHTSEDR